VTREQALVDVRRAVAELHPDRAGELLDALDQVDVVDPTVAAVFRFALEAPGDLSIILRPTFMRRYRGGGRRGGSTYELVLRRGPPAPKRERERRPAILDEATSVTFKREDRRR